MKKKLSHGFSPSENSPGEGILRQATLLVKEGKFAQGETLYRQFLQDYPGNLRALQGLGEVTYRQGKKREAMGYYQQFLEGDPAHQGVLFQLGNIYLEEGEYDQAIRCYERLTVNQNHAEALSNLGVIYEKKGEWEKAITSYKKAIKIQPNLIGSLNNLANILRHQGKIEEGIEYLKQAITYDPNFVPGMINLGAAYQDIGRDLEAISLYEKAVTLSPHQSEAYYNLGVILQKQGEYQKAINAYEKALLFRPDDEECLNNLGNVFQEIGEFQTAINYYNQVINLYPHHGDAHLHRALLWMLWGDFTQGLQEYEWRWKSRQLKGFDENPTVIYSQQRWKGENLAGKTIVLFSEQGLGDVLQFVRYGSILKEMGANVILQSYRELRDILAYVKGIDQVIICGEEIPPFDVQAPLMSLPLICGHTVETIPQNIPYLDPEKIPLSLLLPPSSHLKVGIVWSGNSQHPRNRQRSCPLTHFITHLNFPEVKFYSLQKEVNEEEQKILQRNGIYDCSQLLRNFIDTASIIHQLDLVITIDTSVIHLAGAMGKTVWGLISFTPDWRWLLNREDSPWYPSIRLFRQPQPEDWGTVFLQVKEALKSLISGSSLLEIPNNFVEVTENHYRQILEKNPEQIEALYGLAMILQKAEKVTDAISVYQKIMMIAPQEDQVYFELGNLSQKQGNYEEAIRYFHKGIELNPQRMETYNNLALLKQTQGDIDSAIKIYQQALEIDPNFAEILNNLGSAFKQKENYEEAKNCWRKAINDHPTCFQALMNLALTLQQEKNYQEAGDYYQKALEIESHSAELYYYLGSWYDEQEEFETAIKSYEKALKLHPNSPEVIGNLAKSLQELGRFKEALFYYQKRLELKPKDPQSHLSLALILLLMGELKTGFTEYEWRRWVPHFYQGYPTDTDEKVDADWNPKKYWKGENLQGKTLLVRQEQGFGDQIHLSRYLPLLKQQGATLILECHPNLQRLFHQLSGIDQLIIKGETDHFPPFDYHVLLFSIPCILGTTLENIPQNIPYLFPSLTPKSSLQIPPTSSFKIGMVWRGNPQHQRNLKRSVSLIKLIENIHLIGIQLFNLQKEITTDEKQILSQYSIIDFSEFLEDFADTADLIAQLDLIITIDTSVAHLAGAMGKTVWLLLPFIPDWRWLLDREDTPWYPTFRLFRQPKLGDWESVFQQISSELNLLINSLKSVPIESVIAEANQYIEEQKWLEALPLYQQIINHYPTAQNYNILGVLWQNHQQIELALEHYQKSLEINPNYVEALNNLGNLLQEKAEYSTAISYYQKALKIQPKSIEVLLNFAKCLGAKGEINLAIDTYQTIINLYPDHFSAYYQKALLLSQQGNYTEAIEHDQKAIHFQPNCIEALNHLGNMLQETKQFQEALLCYEKIIAFQPDFPEAYFNLGNLFFHLQQDEKAHESYQKALEIRPNYANAYANLGFIKQKMGQLKEAIHDYQKALEIDPNLPDTWNHLGITFDQLENSQEALHCYEKALSLKPQFEQVLNNLGNSLQKQGKYQEAISYYQKAIDIQPNFAEAINNLGHALQEQGDYHSAFSYYQKAIQYKYEYTDAHLNLALALLLMGKFQEGWLEYEWRLKVRKDRWENCGKPRWDGANLVGKRILITPEQGLGDLIQFIRYIPLVKERGGVIIVECYPPLLRLFSQIPEIDQLLPSGRDFHEFDVHIPLLSLPLIFNTTLTSIPCQIPYLFPLNSPPLQLEDFPFKVGIVWSGNQSHKKNYLRSTSLDYFLKLLVIPQIKYYSLQKEITDSEKNLLLQNSLIDLSEVLQDFTDTAAIINQLDLIITVDTSVAHLAGAMGKTVWLLLAFIPDWRWMLDREDSPWYPTIKLFRQPKIGDWESVFIQVLTELQNLVNPSPLDLCPTNSPTDFSLPSPQIIEPKLLEQVSEFYQQKDWLSAEKLCQEILEKTPNSVDILHLLGVIRYRQGDTENARNLLKKVLEINPNYTDAYNSLAIILKQQGNYSEALENYQKAIRLNPHFSEAYYNLALCLKALEKPTEAIYYYQEALRLNPHYPEVHYSLAMALTETNQTQLAILHYQQAIHQNPQDYRSYLNLSTLLAQQNRFTEGLSYCQQALQLNPHSPETYHNIGLMYHQQGLYDSALSYYQKAIEIKPDYGISHLGIAEILLLKGNFIEGFKEYEWRWKLATSPVRPFWDKIWEIKPLWDGSSLQGKTILLHPEQGIGDSIQMIRYVPLLQQQGAQVIIGIYPELARLFSSISGIKLLVNGDILPPIDYHAPLLSLPRILQTTIDTIPQKIPYLFPPEKNTYTLPPSPFKIGIVWSGNPQNKNDHLRSCSLDYFRQLLSIPEITLYSLQKELKPTEQFPTEIINLSEKLTDFAETAGIISQLDLIITVDTSVAHLAGAMGKPVWLLLAFVADWRWILGREDSPWYPTLRIFRQSKLGDWESVFTQVKNALETLNHPLQDSPITSSINLPFQIQISSPQIPHPNQELLSQNFLQKPDKKNIKSPIFLTNSPQQLGLAWSIGMNSGWGTYGLNLALQLQQNPHYQITLLAPLITSSDSFNPLHHFLLHPILEKQNQFQQRLEQNPHEKINLNFPILHALGNNLLTSNLPERVISNFPIGIIFFEDTQLTPIALEKAQQYQLIITGSQWNTTILQSYGLNHIKLIHQGIDPTIFHPAPKSNLFKDRFVIFSGGKLEYRKGQDIIIAAFKKFHARHPEALLVTAWQNLWPQFMRGLEQTGHVIDLPNIGSNGYLFIKEWLLKNGLSPDAIIDLGLVPNHRLGQIIREADVAVFTNRCEGGTNLVAMEIMACGIPTILSANTGHLDLIHNSHCYPLSTQKPVPSHPYFPGVKGWGESDIEEVLETLERVYHHRQEAQKKAEKAALFMQEWTWEKQTQKFLNSLF